MGGCGGVCPGCRRSSLSVARICRSPEKGQHLEVICIDLHTHSSNKAVAVSRPHIPSPIGSKLASTSSDVQKRLPPRCGLVAPG